MSDLQQVMQRLDRLERKVDRLIDDDSGGGGAARPQQPNEKIPVVKWNEDGEKTWGHKKIAKLAKRAKSEHGVTTGDAEAILGLSRTQTLKKMRKMSQEFDHISFQSGRGGSDPSRIFNRA